MNIQETIDRALKAAGLNTQSGPLRGVTDTIRNALFKSGKFQFINESRRDDLLKEQGFQLGFDNFPLTPALQQWLERTDAAVVATDAPIGATALQSLLSKGVGMTENARSL